MNPQFLAILLACYSACALAGLLAPAVMAAKAGKPLLAVMSVVVALATAAALANAAVDLWGTA